MESQSTAAEDPVSTATEQAPTCATGAEAEASSTDLVTISQVSESAACMSCILVPTAVGTNYASYEQLAPFGICYFAQRD